MNTAEIDLLSVIGRDTKLKKVAGTGGGEWHGACPFCGGTDRFRVQPNREKGGYFACRQCGASGDAIHYIQRRDNVDFLSACKILDLRLSEPTSTRAIRPARDRRSSVQSVTTLETVTPSSVRSDAPALADAAYEQDARDFCCETACTLFSPAGERARDWLYRRGQVDAVLKANAIGFNPTEQRTRWGETDVWLPRGIVIPWQISGDIWRVNFRRPEGEPKYISAKGAASGLYLVDSLKPGSVALLVEGELDALLIRRLVPDLIGAGLRPVATGSTTGARALRWLAMLSLSERVLVAFDDDGPGEQAAQWWLKALGDKAIRLKPTANDVTDMYRAGDDVRGWIVDTHPELNRRAAEALPQHAHVLTVPPEREQEETIPVAVHQFTKPDIWAGSGRCFGVLTGPGLFDRRT